MDFNTFKRLLGIKDNAFSKNALSLSSQNFPDYLQPFFTLGYDNKAINLSNLKLIECDDNQQRLTFTAKGDYLNAPSLDVHLQSVVNDTGQIHLIANYALLGANPGENSWKFSKSFPDLPKTPDENEYLLFNRATGDTWQKERVVLDDFAFFNSAFVISSDAMIDPATGQSLQTGINFISSVRPEGAIAIMANAFSVTSALTVSGTIRLPVQGETPADLKTQFMDNGERPLFPWNIEDQFKQGLPGILLTINTNINSDFGNNAISISGNSLKVYTPMSDDWCLTMTNPSFEPVQALTGIFSLAGANISSELTMPYEPGISQWYGLALCNGLSLDNLTSLSGISGSNSGFLEHLPKELQKMGKALGKLEMTGFSLLVDYSELNNITVKDITLTIGLPELNWQIWPDRFELTDISCTFRVKNPFSKVTRDTSTQLTAQMKVGNVHCSVTASSSDRFAFYAQMDNGENIPLRQLLKKYAPDIPLPAELTVSALKLGVEPGSSYSMAMVMSGEDNSFPIHIGPTTLDVNNLSMYVSYRQEQGFTGSVSAKAILDNNVLRLSY
ncbi:MAG: hypothetical protein ACPGEF_03960, partial [Endozoicomonas sp.]